MPYLIGHQQNPLRDMSVQYELKINPNSNAKLSKRKQNGIHQYFLCNLAFSLHISVKKLLKNWELSFIIHFKGLDSAWTHF